VVFVDAGAFVARYHSRDQYHQQAVDHWKLLEQSGGQCFTTSFVLDEVLTLLARRTSYPFAAARARTFWGSSALSIIRPDEVDEHLALRFFEKYADQRVSFTDCVSFAVMQRLPLKAVFGFDRHFVDAGFILEP
jgi:predicted nucleic acid-binding protein